jgi:PAS domain S-box-containing protein
MNASPTRTLFPDFSIHILVLCCILFTSWHRRQTMKDKKKAKGQSIGAISGLQQPQGKAVNPKDESSQALTSVLELGKRYHELFDESIDAIYITSRDGIYIDVNLAALEMFGYTREEMVGKLNARGTYSNPEDREKFQQEIEAKGSVRNYPIKLLKKDRREMDCLLTSTVRRSQDGEIIGYHGIIRDVTEYKRAEQALKESEARYRAIVQDQTELICRFLPDGTMTFVNEAYCRYFQKDKEELIGHTFMPLIPEEDHEKVGDLLSSLSPECPVATHEHRAIAPDGDIRWHLWTNRMVLDANGRLIEFQAVGRDITRRKKMEEALKESSEKIKLFAYSISHDLKSPAIGIYGLTRRLYKHCWDHLDEKGRSYCDQILKAAEQIASLAEKINLYISAKESALSIEPVRLKEILAMVKEEFSTRLGVQRITWIEPEGLPEIRADRLSLLRVFRNLVDNALKYGGDELSEIRVGYEASQDFHTLTVSDDGIAIPQEESEKIFQLFQRQRTDRCVEGSGLGLAIVKEISQQHGGKVWVESGHQKGNVFYISLSRHL